MSRSICFMLCSLILVFSSAVVHSQPGKTALVGGTVYPVSAPPIENGVVLINGDTIEAVGAGLSVPRDYQRIDVTGKSVFPGLINAYTNLGLHEYGRLVPSTVDIDETTDRAWVPPRSAIARRRSGFDECGSEPGQAEGSR